MKSIKSILFLMFAVLIFASSCKDSIAIKEDALIQIPADASMITSINLKQLLEKADFEKIKTMAFYKDAIAEAEKDNPALAKILADPYESGIDLNSNAYIAYDVDNKNPEDIFTTFVFSITNESAFESMLNNANISDFQSKNNYKFATEGRKALIAWGNNKAVLGMGSRYTDLAAKAEKIFTTTKENSIANDPNLKKCLNQNYDIASWMSSNAIAENPQLTFLLGMANIAQEDLKDNFVHSYVNFEKGEVVGTSEYFLQNGLTKEFKLLFKDKVNTDFSKMIPSDDLSMLMTASLDLKGIGKIINSRSMVKNYMGSELKKYDLTVDDFIDAIDGDIMVAGYNPENVQNTNGIFALTIKDESTFQKFIDLAVEHEMLTKTGDLYTINDRNINRNFGSKPKLMLNNNMLVISANDDLLGKIQDGGLEAGKRVDSKLYGKVSNNVFGAFLDFEVMKNAAKSLEEMEAMNINNLEISAGRKKSDFKLNLKDKSNNSLKSIFEMLNDAYLKNKDKKYNADAQSI